MQANIGDQRTILFIAGIVTIWIPVTSRRFEDTPLSAIGTRPPVGILNFWELGEALAITKGFSHVTAVLTQGLIPSAAGNSQGNTSIIVAC